MSGDSAEDGREKGRYEREVEARFGRTSDGADAELAPEPMRRNPAIAWLLFIAAIVIVVALCWSRIAPLMHRSVAPTPPPGQAHVQPLPGAQSHPKRPAHDYPPCTATRTDRCVQKEDGNQAASAP